MTKEGLQFQSDGYVYVDEVLAHPSFAGKYTMDDVRECVDTNDKKRFGLKTDEKTGKEMIRAHQGHSIGEANVSMREITDPNEFPVVLHGTYEMHWQSIQAKVISLQNKSLQDSFFNCRVYQK